MRMTTRILLLVNAMSFFLFGLRMIMLTLSILVFTLVAYFLYNHTYPEENYVES